MSTEDILKWGGRLIATGAGVGFIVVGATHDPKSIASIVTGACILALVLYAIIRDLGGTIQPGEGQIVGLISLSTWYDVVVALALIAIVVVMWIVQP